MKNTKGRIGELDSIRGIAAILVVLFHYVTLFRPILNYQFSKKIDFNLGRYGVQLFFIISGFVIFMSLNKITNIKDFAIKRFIRLYPTYWLCLTITLFFISLIKHPHLTFTTKEKLINLLMFQNLFNVKNIDGSYWSLVPELLFYIQMGIIYKLGLINKIRYVLFIWLILIFFSALKPSILDIYLNLRYGMYFIAGICFYRIKNKQANIIEHIQILLCLISVLIVFKDLTTLFASFIIFGTFYLFVFNKLHFLSNALFYFLGYISYPLYLIHQSIGLIIIHRLNLIGLPEFVSILIALIISISIAWVISKYFEESIIKNLKKHLLEK